MELYTYYRSTSSYRVRIALGLKGLGWQAVPVNPSQCQHRGSWYLAPHPQWPLPALPTAQRALPVPSPSIRVYPAAAFPSPSPLPAPALDRATGRCVAALPGCPVHSSHTLELRARICLSTFYEAETDYSNSQTTFRDPSPPRIRRRCRNINLLPISYASLPRLRGRLTLRR